MVDGRIDAQGSIKALEARGILGIITRKSELEQKSDDAETRTLPDDVQPVVERVVEEKGMKTFSTQHNSINASGTEVTLRARSSKKKARKLVEDEERPKGNVKWTIYKTYLEAAGWFTWIFLGIFVAAFQVCLNVVSWFLASLTLQ